MAELVEQYKYDKQGKILMIKAEVSYSKAHQQEKVWGCECSDKVVIFEIWTIPPRRPSSESKNDLYIINNKYEQSL